MGLYLVKLKRHENLPYQLLRYVQGVAVFKSHAILFYSLKMCLACTTGRVDGANG